MLNSSTPPQENGTGREGVLLQLLGVGEAGRLGEGGVPEVRGLRAERLVLVREGDAEQGGEVAQELVVVGQRGATLQAAQHLHQELLQLHTGTRGGRLGIWQQFSNAQIRIWASTYDDV